MYVYLESLQRLCNGDFFRVEYIPQKSHVIKFTIEYLNSLFNTERIQYITHLCTLILMEKIQQKMYTSELYDLIVYFTLSKRKIQVLYVLFIIVVCY